MQKSAEQIQRDASKYVESLCDLCVRAKPDVECEDYDPQDARACPEVYCVAYREKTPRGKTGRVNNCSLYAPDIYRIRSVMAHAAMRNAQELAALDALLNG